MAKKKMSAPAAVIEVLKDEGGPLHVKEITKRVIAGYDTGLKGKTPQATIGAKLHTAAAKGETFRKVDKGTFELLPEGENPGDGEAKDEESPAVTPNSVVVRDRKPTQEGEAHPDPKPGSGRPRSSTSRRRSQAAAAS